MKKNRRFGIKNILTIAAAVIAALGLFTTGCSETEAGIANGLIHGLAQALEEESEKTTTLPQETKADEKQTTAAESVKEETTKEKSEKETGQWKYDAEDEEGGYYPGPREWTVVESNGFDISKIDIPEYKGNPTQKINNNEPFFTKDEIEDEYFMEIAELDELGRCKSNWMCADEAHIQEGERGKINDIHPSGWHTGGFYQRSHLLMWKLTGCNNKKNMISGTDTLNQEAMLEYEERITDYLWHNEKNHVMYRVTPQFIGDELIARGVLMEAYSVEDGGKGLKFCVFVYNVEPGYEIDYMTGEYSKT